MVGGITVLTDLNPWVVSFHLLVSLGIISLAVLYLRRIDVPSDGGRASERRRCSRRLAWTTYAAAWVVLYLGTVVTGSGPHAGDLEAPRNGLDPLQISQLHADVGVPARRPHRRRAGAACTAPSRATVDACSGRGAGDRG